MVFVKWKEVVWCRATVVEVFQKSCVKAVKACPVTQLASLRVFFPDYGFTKSITIQSYVVIRPDFICLFLFDNTTAMFTLFLSEEAAAESLLKAVNNHLRKVAESVNVELKNFAPQAVRCSLKDLVPYNLVGSL